MEETFLKATGACARLETHLRIAGHAVRLCFAGPALMPLLLPALEHLLAPSAQGPPGLTVHIRDEESTGVRLPPVSWKLDRIGLRGEALDYSDDRFLTAVQTDVKALSMLDRQRGVASYWVARGEDLPVYERAAPLKTVLHWWLRERGLPMIHAGAVGTAAGTSPRIHSPVGASPGVHSPVGANPGVRPTAGASPRIHPPVGANPGVRPTAGTSPRIHPPVGASPSVRPTAGTSPRIHPPVGANPGVRPIPEEGAVLLVGQTGAGKSTAALACLDAGMRYLSDDRCLLALEPEPRVHCIYNAAKLRPEQMRRFPRLLPAVRNPGEAETEKALVFVNEYAPERLAPSLPVRAVLLARVSGKSGTSVEPVSPAPVLRELAVSSMIYQPGMARDELRMMADLVRRVPCYRIHLGSDLESVPRGVAQAIEESMHE